ncbi:MAG: SDR family NAD(P)-dependent oxidoreductase [Geobacteraceae bacterium]|nr:SDR family NAD(P)-dependent oxidoreductase [Geobacteraceae bacterium]
MSTAIDLTGKVAIVTGAGSGLGKGIALCLAKAGANVAIADVNVKDAQKTAKEIMALGRKSFAIKTDVTKENEVFAMVDEVVRKLGKLDIMCPNAGTCCAGPIDQLSAENWDKMMQINLYGHFYCVKAALKYMKPQKSGKIVMTASQAGRVAVPLLAGYSASKFAVTALTKAVAQEVAADNIQVNCIGPGIIRTKIWDKILGDLVKAGLGEADALYKSFLDSIPSGREQTPEDIGNAVTFLASNLASEITGDILIINGGQFNCP